MEKPKVSVVIPCRNEEKYISHCVEGFLKQDYPDFELLFVDGMSNDKTVSILEEYQKRDKRITIIPNPEKVTPNAFNYGIKAATGDIITIFSAHSFPEADYLAAGVNALLSNPVDCAGGNMKAEAQNYTGQAISAATSHFFGVGNSRFHYYTRKCEVDTVYQGFYRREVFEKIGLFDEMLIRDQDDEFNYRLKSAGGKILLDPEIRSVYHSRAGMKKLFRQYYQYGLYKVLVVRKHPGQVRLRHFIPAIFVLGLFLSIFSIILGLYRNTSMFFIPSILPAFYFLLNGIFSIVLGLKKGFRLIFILPLIFFTLHFAYGMGFIIGWFVFGFRKIQREAAV